MPWLLLLKILSKFCFYRNINESVVSSLTVTGRVTLLQVGFSRKPTLRRRSTHRRGTREGLAVVPTNRAQPTPWEALRLAWFFRVVPSWSEGADTLSRLTRHWIQPDLWRGSDFGWHDSFLLRQFPGRALCRELSSDNLLSSGEPNPSFLKWGSERHSMVYTTKTKLGAPYVNNFAFLYGGWWFPTETELWHEWVQWEFLFFTSITITQSSTTPWCCRFSRKTAEGFFLGLGWSSCLQSALSSLCTHYYVTWLYFLSDIQTGTFVTLCLSSLGCLCKNDQLFKRKHCMYLIYLLSLIRTVLLIAPFLWH